MSIGVLDDIIKIAGRDGSEAAHIVALKNLRNIPGVKAGTSAADELIEIVKEGKSVDQWLKDAQQEGKIAKDADLATLSRAYNSKAFINGAVKIAVENKNLKDFAATVGGQLEAWENGIGPRPNLNKLIDDFNNANPGRKLTEDHRLVKQLRKDYNELDKSTAGKIGPDAPKVDAPKTEAQVQAQVQERRATGTDAVAQFPSQALPESGSRATVSMTAEGADGGSASRGAGHGSVSGDASVPARASAAPATAKSQLIDQYAGTLSKMDGFTGDAVNIAERYLQRARGLNISYADVVSRADELLKAGAEENLTQFSAHLKAFNELIAQKQAAKAAKSAPTPAPASTAADVADDAPAGLPEGSLRPTVFEPLTPSELDALNAARVADPTTPAPGSPVDDIPPGARLDPSAPTARGGDDAPAPSLSRVSRDTPETQNFAKQVGQALRKEKAGGDIADVKGIAKAHNLDESHPLVQNALRTHAKIGPTLVIPKETRAWNNYLVKNLTGATVGEYRDVNIRFFPKLSVEFTRPIIQQFDELFEKSGLITKIRDLNKRIADIAAEPGKSLDEVKASICKEMANFSRNNAHALEKFENNLKSFKATAETIEASGDARFIGVNTAQKEALLAWIDDMECLAGNLRKPDFGSEGAHITDMVLKAAPGNEMNDAKNFLDRINVIATDAHRRLHPNDEAYWFSNRTGAVYKRAPEQITESLERSIDQAYYNSYRSPVPGGATDNNLEKTWEEMETFYQSRITTKPDGTKQIDWKSPTDEQLFANSTRDFIRRNMDHEAIYTYRMLVARATSGAADKSTIPPGVIPILKADPQYLTVPRYRKVVDEIDKIVSPSALESGDPARNAGRLSLSYWAQKTFDWRDSFRYRGARTTFNTYDGLFPKAEMLPIALPGKTRLQYMLWRDPWQKFWHEFILGGKGIEKSRGVGDDVFKWRYKPWPDFGWKARKEAKYGFWQNAAATVGYQIWNRVWFFPGAIANRTVVPLYTNLRGPTWAVAKYPLIIGGTGAAATALVSGAYFLLRDDSNSKNLTNQIDAITAEKDKLPASDPRHRLIDAELKKVQELLPELAKKKQTLETAEIKYQDAKKAYDNYRNIDTSKLPAGQQAEIATLKKTEEDAKAARDAAQDKYNPLNEQAGQISGRWAARTKAEKEKREAEEAQNTALKTQQEAQVTQDRQKILDAEIALARANQRVTDAEKNITDLYTQHKIDMGLNPDGTPIVVAGAPGAAAAAVPATNPATNNAASGGTSPAAGPAPGGDTTAQKEAEKQKEAERIAAEKKAKDEKEAAEKAAAAAQARPTPPGPSGSGGRKTPPSSGDGKGFADHASDFGNTLVETLIPAESNDPVSKMANSFLRASVAGVKNAGGFVADASKRLWNKADGSGKSLIGLGVAGIGSVLAMSTMIAPFLDSIQLGRIPLMGSLLKAGALVLTFMGFWKVWNMFVSQKETNSGDHFPHKEVAGIHGQSQTQKGEMPRDFTRSAYLIEDNNNEVKGLAGLNIVMKGDKAALQMVADNRQNYISVGTASSTFASQLNDSGKLIHVPPHLLQGRETSLSALNASAVPHAQTGVASDVFGVELGGRTHVFRLQGQDFSQLSMN